MLTVPEPHRVLQKAASLSNSVSSCVFKTPGLQSLFVFHCEGNKAWKSRRGEGNLNAVVPLRSSLDDKRVFPLIPTYLSKRTAAAHPFCLEYELSAIQHECR